MSKSPFSSIISFYLLFTIISPSISIISIKGKTGDILPKIKNRFNQSKIISESNINLCLPYTWLSQWDIHFFFPKNITPLLTSNISFFGNYYEANQYTDNFILYINNSTILQNFSFYSIKLSRFYGSQTGIGFAYKFPNENFSVINNLFTQGIIDKRIFAFDFSNENKEKIHLGGIPKEIFTKTHSNYYGQFKVDKDKNLWGNNIREIHQGNNKFKVNYYSYLQTLSYDVIYSKQFYDFFINNIIKKEIQNNTCNKELYISGYFKIYCKFNITKELPLKLIYDDVVMIISMNILFGCKHSECVSRFGYYKNRISDNLEFGLDFMKKFNFIVFDYDLESVFFYGNEWSFFQSKFNKILYLKSIMILVIILESWGYIFLFISNKKNKTICY